MAKYQIVTIADGKESITDAQATGPTLIEVATATGPYRVQVAQLAKSQVFGKNEEGNDVVIGLADKSWHDTCSQVADQVQASLGAPLGT